MDTDILPVAYVIFPEEDWEVEESLDDSVARLDDAFWAKFVYRGFTWQRFIDWWIARRWIVPRDIRKR